MPPKKKPQPVQLPDLSRLMALNINTDLADSVLFSSGIGESVRDIFARLNNINCSIKEISKSVNHKVPSTPKKVASAYQKVLNEIEELQNQNVLEESVAALSMIVDAPEPVQEVVSQVSEKKVLAPIVPETPKKTREKVFAVSTPSRTPHVFPSTPKSPSRAFSVSAANKNIKLVVPKAANSKKMNPSEIAMKSKLEMEEAEKRRVEIMNDKKERIRREREERERKVKQNQQEEENIRKKLNDQRKEKELRLKELEAINAEDQRTNKLISLKVPTTPKNAHAEHQITPRQLHVPAKKPKDRVISHVAENVTSPVLKRKPITRSKKDVPKNEPASEPEERMELDSNDRRGEDDIFVLLSADEAAAVATSNIPIQLAGRRSYNEQQCDSMDLFEQHERESAKLFKKKGSSKASAHVFAEESSILKRMSPLKTNTCLPNVLNETIAKICEETVTVAKDEEENVNPVAGQKEVNTYDMTADKVFLPSTEENYVVDDLSSNDETDDENQPRKTVPIWAKKEHLNPTVRKMLDRISMDERVAYFGPPAQPSLELLFPESKLQSNRHRNSSSVWNSPLSAPTPWTRNF